MNETKQIQELAREVGMLVKVKGTEYASCVRRSGLEMTFENATPDTMAYIDIYTDVAPFKRVASYNAHQLEELRIDYPQFF